jgi:uncharacterized protein
VALHRRAVLKGLVAGCLAAGGGAGVAQPVRAWDPAGGLRIWDTHSHLDDLPGDTPEARMAVLVRHMDRLGVERLMLSQGYCDHDSHPTQEQVRLENDRVMRAVRHFPDRAYGWVFFSPDNVDFCLKEFDRCVRNGPMIGVGELEDDVLWNSPSLDPIVDAATSINVPILFHTWIISSGNPPGESTPQQLVELARRHPRAQIICGHTGGNWELGIRAIRSTPNLYSGIAGSDPTSGFAEMAVRELGAERVIYGSDVGGRCFASQIAKVVGADIPDSAKELILGGNLRRLLRPILKARGLES